MLVIPNTTTTAADTAAAAAVFPSGGDVGALTPFVAGYLFVANAAAAISIRKGPTSSQAQWTPYALVSPTMVPISTDRGGRHTPDFVYGVKAVDGVAGTHAQVFGALFQAGEAGFVPSAQFSGTISAAGAFTPPTVSLPLLLVSNGTLVDVVNNASETNIWTQSVPGNTLDSNDGLRVRLLGDFLNNTGVNRLVTFRIYFGGTLMWSSPAGAYDIVGGATRRPWSLDFLIANRNSFTSQVLNGDLKHGTMTPAPTGIGTQPTDMGFTAGSLAATSASVTPLEGTATVDTTLLQPFVVSVQNSIADPNLSTRILYGVVERV